MSNTKPRFDILDGLRGVAALLVVVYHITEGYAAGPLTHMPNHGYLAVDFFFLLSGYVVGYAYDDRLTLMGTSGFIKRRLIRLHPMIVFGTILGVLLYYFSDGHPSFKDLSATPWWLLLLVGAWCSTLIPVPAALDIRGWADFNPLNGATWSLVWEYIGNILYILLFSRLSTRVLSLLTAGAAVLTLLLCLNVDVFGVLEVRTSAAYTVIGGWNFDADQVVIGFTRLLYPFIMGLLLSRMGQRVRLRGNFVVCTLLLVALLCMPRIGGTDTANFWMNGAYEALCILVLFPLILLMGAGSGLSKTTETKVCNFLGRISYPLYVVHLPIVFAQMSWAAQHSEAPLGAHFMTALFAVLISIATAYAALKLYDEPLRKRLMNRFLSRGKN